MLAVKEKVCLKEKRKSVATSEQKEFIVASDDKVMTAIKASSKRNATALRLLAK